MSEYYDCPIGGEKTNCKTLEELDKHFEQAHAKTIRAVEAHIERFINKVYTRKIYEGRLWWMPSYDKIAWGELRYIKNFHLSASKQAVIMPLPFTLTTTKSNEPICGLTSDDGYMLEFMFDGDEYGQR